MLHDSDLFGCVKPRTDVLLRGSAHAPRGEVTTLDTGVSVGPVKKRVRAWGDRRFQLGAGGRLELTPPAPFRAMALTWENAYGGRDLYAERKLAAPPRKTAESLDALMQEEAPGMFSYPRNEAGRGFFLALDLERLHGAPAPNLEDPDDPVLPARMLAEGPLDWLDRPAAACYEPIDWYTFPRAMFLVPPMWRAPGRPVHEVACGALGEQDLAKVDLGGPADARLYNCAPSGLAVARLEGGERVALQNLHPRHELLEFDLPGDRPRMVVELPGVGPREIEPSLQTVELRPEDDLVTLTWAGTMEVRAPYPDELLAQMRHMATWSR